MWAQNLRFLTVIEQPNLGKMESTEKPMKDYRSIIVLLVFIRLTELELARREKSPAVRVIRP
jgi:hypothetical protein